VDKIKIIGPRLGGSNPVQGKLRSHGTARDEIGRIRGLKTPLVKGFDYSKIEGYPYNQVTLKPYSFWRKKILP
jgi:hypothetical protein